MTEIVLLLLVTGQGRDREAEQVYPVYDPTTVYLPGKDDV